MKKGIFVALTLIGLSLFISTLTFAQTNIPASATVPGPTAVDPSVIKVMGTGSSPANWDGEVSSMSFDPLTLNTFPNPDPTKAPFQVFLPDHFFSIDMGYLYGPGTSITQITTSYSDTLSPQTHGLGWKTTATFVRKFILPDGSEKTESLPADLAPGTTGKILLKDVTSKSFLLSQISPGWLRMYVGIVTKDPAAILPDPTLAEVFSPGDTAGTYAGNLVISSL